LIEKRLCFEGFEGNDFEAARAADTELGSQEVDGRGFCRNVELLKVYGWLVVATAE
jgi:hypothetical protein